jgi:arylsulfatase A-like enzyme
MFMNAPVCSSTRSGIILGTMQTTLGVHNHRSSRTEVDPIHLPEGVKTIPELFKEAGYFTFNRGKDDYNFVYDRDRLYDGKYKRGFHGTSGAGDWRDRAPGQPFFGQIQLAGGKAGKRAAGRFTPEATRATLPPTYPDDPILLTEWANHYGCAEATDEDVAAVLKKLKADGLLENTVVFFFSDHGYNRGLRHKQFCYDGGLHVPCIVRWPARPGVLKPGTVREDLASGIDIATTSLALAGIDIPAHMEGKNLFAPDFHPREYVVSARDRCDYTIDRIRTVRTRRYRYIRNYLTDRPWMQPQYRDGWPVTKLMRRLYAEGKLNAVQARFMSDQRPGEELYDIENDPHEIHDLAADPAHAGELGRHRALLDGWVRETGGGIAPESEEGLLAALMRWGNRCVNPEYDAVRKKFADRLPPRSDFDRRFGPAKKKPGPASR